MVLDELRGQFSHFFVDEFQDTDPLQIEILFLLSGGPGDPADWRKVSPVPGKLFIVGDPKQSIYRFRRADIDMYEGIKKHLVAAGAETLALTTSFRSVPSIQSFVNASFTPLMPGSGESHQTHYVPLQPARPEITDRPTVITLPSPNLYKETGNITRETFAKSYADVAAAFIDWLTTTSEWTIETENGNEPIAPHHICLLFKRMRSSFEDITGPYVGALEARGVPHVLVGGRAFFDREETLALVSALRAIEWPDDELSVFATLHGPFFAFNDTDLLVWRQEIGSLRPTRKVDLEALDPTLRPVGETLQLLGSLHRQRNRRPAATTIQSLLDAARAHASIAMWPRANKPSPIATA